MNKRILSMLLLTAMLAASSCGSAGGNGTATDTTVPSDETTVVDNTPKLGFERQNNNGKTFNILTTVHAEYEYVSEEQTGDVVNDAVYNRNADVEDLLGIDLNFIVEPGHWADRNSFNSLIRNSVMAGDGAYDLVNGVTVCVLPIASEGVFIDSNQLEYVDLTKPWWVQGMTDNLAVGGKLFGFIGDASLSLYKDLSVMYYSKEMLESRKLEDPYELVRSGKWTIDKLAEMARLGAQDLNGDGSMEKDVDCFGYLAHYVPQRAFQTATEMKVIDFDGEGNPFFTDLSERNVDIFSRLNSFLMDRTIVYAADVSDHSTLSSVFSGGRAMFMCDFLYVTEYLRDMPGDFGIIPMPKSDEEQENYHSQIGTSTSMFFVPKTTPDAKLTSMVCEALSYYSSQNVVPSYYEVALKEKYTRDEDVKEMLEIIRSGAQMDFTYAYSTMFSPFPNTLVECREGNAIGDNLSSFYDSKKTAWQATIDTLLDAYASID